jgi:hypothetical protein
VSQIILNIIKMAISAKIYWEAELTELFFQHNSNGINGDSSMFQILLFNIT